MTAKRSEHIWSDIEEAARRAGLPVHKIVEELIEQYREKGRWDKEREPAPQEPGLRRPLATPVPKRSNGRSYFDRRRLDCVIPFPDRRKARKPAKEGPASSEVTG